MNYIINIKTRDIITAGIVIVFVSSKVEKKLAKIYKKVKKEKEILKKAAEEAKECLHEEITDAVYCPCCGKKLVDD